MSILSLLVSFFFQPSLVDVSGLTLQNHMRTTLFEAEQAARLQKEKTFSYVLSTDFSAVSSFLVMLLLAITSRGGILWLVGLQVLARQSGSCISGVYLPVSWCTSGLACRFSGGNPRKSETPWSLPSMFFVAHALSTLWKYFLL